ncbi:transcription initiation factor TFIID subunit 11 isoform X3 [Pyrus x bretschneideri]|uniref:transcription initiation factor TFIID subunit 11 isoform X3 n=1 Tax=Pyrus x bretschneideri TaxID=225117 RepID=UPI00202DE453|nr:transcription initiation factor TFIID subunit 11 isoform X3 [Pyrus x bretschneideri]
MAETKDQGEPTFPAKRKPDLSCGDQPDCPNKTQKLEVPDDSPSAAEAKSQTPENFKNNSSAGEEKTCKFEANADLEDEDEEEDYEEEEEEDEKSNGKAEMDRKGKGIMRDDKGKGKLVEEDDDDSDDDSSDGGSEFEDGDSDLSDDPLAEVDLDNILPSRTRRRQVQPGVYIANDNGMKKKKTTVMTAMIELRRKEDESFESRAQTCQTFETKNFSLICGKASLGFKAGLSR